MANAIYPKYKQSLLNGDANVDLDTNTAQDGVYAMLVNTTSGDGAGNFDSYNSADQFYSDIAAGSIIGTPQRITTSSVSTSAIYDGDDVTFTAVSSAYTADAIVLYRANAGANTTWRLVAWIDTGVTGLPVTPNGGNIVISWNVTGIFQL